MKAFLLVIFLAAGDAWAQTPAAPPDPCTARPRSSFDVTTVRPTEGRAGSSSTHGYRDSFAMMGTVRRMILYAFDIHEFQLIGGPDWVNTSIWEIKGKIDPPEPDADGLDAAARKLARARALERMQSMLMDRFALRCHADEKELPVYELTVAKGGPRFQVTTTAGGRHSIQTDGNRRGTEVTATGIGMDELAASLSRDVGREVIDKTGLTGRYDLKMSFSNDTHATADDAAPLPDVFTAVDEQLGLKLVPAKGPVQVIVIDSIQKPDEN